MPSPDPVMSARQFCRLTVDSAHCYEVALYDVHNAVAANAQTVILASVEALRKQRIIGQRRHSSADGAHALLVGHVAARRRALLGDHSTLTAQ